MKNLKILLLVVIGMLPAIPAMADDIDIYSQSVATSTENATVLLTLDINANPAGIICSNILLGQVPAAGDISACEVLQGDTSVGNLLDFLGFGTLTDYLEDELCGGLLAEACAAIVNPLIATIDTIASGLGVLVVDLPLSAVEGILGPIVSAVPLTEIDLLERTLDALLGALVDKVNLGVMVSHYDGSNVTGSACFTGAATGHDAATREAQTGCSNGAYLLLPAKALTTANLSATVTEIVDKLNDMRTAVGVSTADNAFHPYQGKEIYFEAVQYFEGDAVYNGHLGYHDFADSNNSTNLDTSLPLLSWSTSHEDGSDNYLSPYDASTPGVDGSCGPAFMVNVMLTDSQQDGESDIRIRTDLPGIENAVTDGDSDTDGLDDLSFEDMVVYLADTGFQREVEPGTFVQTTVQSYFLLNGTADSNLLSNVASSVTSLPLTINPFSFTNEFDGIEATITLSTSVSQTTPVSPLVAGSADQFTNDVFVSLFQPSASTQPQWSGNLKKLTFDSVNDNRLEDSQGAAAVGDNGRLADGTRSFWTAAPTDDGGTVELGGAGANIPLDSGDPRLLNSDGFRQLFTEPTAGTSLLALDATDANGALLQADFGVASATEAKRMIQFARGYNGNDVSSPVPRSWMIGAVLHSQPIALNYGARGSYTDANPDIRVLFGSTDGLFRMIRNKTSGGAESGAEVWAFMPREVMSDMPALQANVPGADMIYGVDGAPVVYTEDVNLDGNLIAADGDRVWVFFGLRRGGTAYYALDISDPDNPSFLWKITKTGDFADLGLTFSTPRISTKTFPTPGGGGVLKTGPILMFAGGYDASKDAESGSTDTLGDDDTSGNAIYVVDAETGLLVWKAAEGAVDYANNTTNRVFKHPLLTDSIPSTVTALDTDGDRQIDRGYVGDTGGRVWRIDMAGSDLTTWTVHPIASVGRHNDEAANSPADVADDRRFFHRPDFVKARDFQGPYDAVVIGSGDRADPFNETTRNNVYMIKDRNVVSGVATTVIDATDSEAELRGHYNGGSGDTLFDVSATCDTVAGACPASASLTNGWRFQLGADGAGEKMVSTPFTISGNVFFTTFTPPQPTGECRIEEGFGRIYGVGLANAKPTVNLFFQTTDVATDPDGDDRSTLLASPGYADSVVYIGDGNILRSDMQAQNVFERKTFPTFWRERLRAEEEPLDQN